MQRHASNGRKSAHAFHTRWLVRLRHYEALTSWRREFCGVGQVWCGVRHASPAQWGIFRSPPHRQETGLIDEQACLAGRHSSAESELHWSIALR
jgi:hypothetical protein